MIQEDTHDLPAVVNVDREMTVQELSAQSLKIHAILERVMVENIHYGVIPGTEQSGKKTLYQAGAEKICATFRLAPKYEVEDLSEPHNNFYRYRVKCSLHTIRDGYFVGSAMGEASTAEEKYQWERAVCDKHWQETDPTRRRVKFKKTRDNEEGFVEIQQVQRNCADLSNTVLKIACKRAFVSATKGATAASDLLDVDLDEEAVADLKKSEAKETPKPKAKSRPAPKLAFGRSKGKEITDTSVPNEDLAWMLDYIAKNVGSEKRKPYEKQDREMMSALEAELKKREGSAKPQPPAMDDDAWVDCCRMWLEQNEPIYAEVCMEFKINDATELKSDLRHRFQLRVKELMNA